MGANSSKEYSETINKIRNKLSQDCSASTSQTQNISNVKVALRGKAICDNISIKNRAAASSNCSLDSTIDFLATQATKLTDEQKAGLGINVSDSIEVNKSVIENELSSACTAGSAQTQDISGINVEIWDSAQCKIIDIMNEADATTSCVVATVNKYISQIEKEKKKTQAGLNPADVIKGLLPGFGGQALPIIGSSSGSSSLCCCILIVVVVLVFALGAGGQGGADDLSAYGATTGYPTYGGGYSITSSF